MLMLGRVRAIELGPFKRRVIEMEKILLYSLIGGGVKAADNSFNDSYIVSCAARRSLTSKSLVDNRLPSHMLRGSSFTGSPTTLIPSSK